MARNIDTGSPLHWMPGFPGARKRGEVQIQIIGNLGDENPLEYGGHIVYRVYDPKNGTRWIRGEYWSEPINDIFLVYQWDVEKDVLRDLNWVEWNDVARHEGIGLEELKRMANSEEILKRARVYEMVGQFYGFDNLDGYREYFSRDEIEKRWPEFV